MVNAREAIFKQVRYPLASHRRTITQRLQGTITGAGGAGGARHPTPGTPSEPRAWRKLIFSLAGLCLCTGQVKLRAGAPFIAATAFVQCGLQPLKCSVYSSLACCAQVLKSRIEERKVFPAGAGSLGAAFWSQSKGSLEKAD